MRFATVKKGTKQFVAVVDEQFEKILPLNEASKLINGKEIFPETLIECISLGEVFMEHVRKIMEWVSANNEVKNLYQSIKEVQLLAPIPRPNKNIFCIGKNYADHAIEMGSIADIPEQLIVFTKAPTTVVGHEAFVMYDQDVTSKLDYEGELAVVIGKQGKNIAKEAALQHVFGYTIINDVTARDLQTQHKQFFLGKSLDTTCPMGPWIVHRSHIPDPHDLLIETRINGEVRQSARTNQLIFPIDEIISVLSKGMTLEAGDIIATGTPAGVGKGMKPPNFLKPKDKMEISIQHIGTLRNEVMSL